MPKNAVNARQRADEFKSDGLYASDSLTLMCKYCNCRVTFERKDSVVKHIKSDKHINSKQKITSGPSSTKIQSSIVENFGSAKRRKMDIDYLALKTTEAFAKANIPLEKLEDPHLKSWINEFVEGGGDLPCVKTLRQNYTPQLAETHFQSVKDVVADNHLYILSDETTDSMGRCVFVILFQVFTEVFDAPKLVVASVNFLQKADATTCAQVITECVSKYGIQYNNILGFVTDSARYMTKCITSLQVLYGDHVCHVQCWAHKLSIVGHVLSNGLDEVNCVVVNVKAAFLNTRKRRHQYLKYLEEETSQPASPFPMPVITRWNSWFRAVFYLAEYFVHIIDFFRGHELQEVNNAGIRYLMSLSDKDVKLILAECTFIRHHAVDLVNLLTKLEGTKYPTAHTLYGDIECILKEFDCISKGIFCSAFDNVITNLNTSEQAHVKHECQKATTLSMDKLNMLLNSDPSGPVFKALNKLFNPKNIILNQSENVISLMKTIPELKNLENSELFIGYQTLQESVQDICKTDKELDIVKVLTALSVNKKKFSAAVLHAIFKPTNNVDSERLLSHYNLVVTDRRQNLKEANIEVFTMLSFDKSI